MSIQSLTAAPSATNTAATRRAALRTRPPFQRALIRSWEYTPAIRATVLIVRLLVVLWLTFLGALLLSADNAWGWVLFPSAAAVLAIGVWVFVTAAKGWPAL